MDILIRYGFTIDEIKIMMDTNLSIEDINDDNIKDIIDNLELVNCSKEEIIDYIKYNIIF